MSQPGEEASRMESSSHDQPDAAPAVGPGRDPRVPMLTPGDGIMVVDDTPSALQLMVELLHRQGYHVRPATSGELALRSAFSRAPELMLLDVQMPGLDGYEVCRRLKADPRTANVPVIFLSALRDTESRVRGLEAGAVDFISKPFQAGEVLARVRTHLMLGRAFLAMDQMCSHLEQAVTERADDLGVLSRSLAQQVAAHEETWRRLRLASSAIESAHDAILITDADWTVVAANPACLAATGYPSAGLVGRSALALLDHEGQIALPDEIGTTLERAGRWAGEVWLRTGSGQSLPVWMSLTEFRAVGDEVTHHVGVFSDITARKEAEARIQYLAHHDLLTGLPNRVLLRDRFLVAQSQARRAGNRLGILFIDLDKFKTINDSLGHSVGDSFLKAVAREIGAALRESDTLCRMGGDEFIALAGGLEHQSDIEALGNRILAAVDQEFLIEGHPLRRSASIGIAMHPDDGDGFDDLVRMADNAMYRAKQSGRAAFVFHTDEMNDELQRRIEMENALRTGISSGELFMRYQPQVDLATGRILAMEALVRWDRPGCGELAPGAFVPLAEESGLIIAMGQQVVSLVCSQTKQWLDAGIAVPVAINVSPVEIWHGHLDTVVLNALAEVGLPPEYLEVEITENGLIDDTAHTREMIGRMQDHGVRLAIDDFLTGYSNFTYLRRFSPAHLKIDRSFVTQMTQGSENHAIVQAAIQMANILRIPSIAEGVETEEQRGLLREAGCPIGQGFLFARPMLAGDATHLLRVGYCVPDSGSHAMTTITSAPSDEEPHQRQSPAHARRTGR